MDSKNAAIRVHILHKLPTPYNDELFQALAANNEIDLHVHHLWRGNQSRPWQTELGTGYPNTYMKTILGVDWGFLWSAFRTRRALFIIGDWGHAAAILPILARIIVRAPIAQWTDTPQEQLPRSMLKRLVRRLVLGTILPRVDLVFASGVPGMRAIAQMGVKQSRIVNLPFFVDLHAPARLGHQEEFQQRCSRLRSLVGLDKNGTAFCVAGQLTEKKGVDVAIRAFASIAERKDNVGLLVAGVGPDFEKLQMAIEGWNLQKRVSLLGWLEPHELEILYGAADVFVHPARYDPYPIVVLEAMAWGLPVIGTSSSGSVADRIDHMRNGLVVPPSDSDSLAEMMSLLADDQALRDSLGQRARATAEEWPLERGEEILVQAVKRVWGAEEEPAI